MDLVYRADHGEGSLRILVKFTAEQRFKATDGVLKRYIAPFQTGKLLGNRERLREILLHAAGTIDNEAVIAAARCVADFCRACEDGGESVSCFRTGGNEFALIRPEPRANSGQLHRQFSAIVARYNRTCAPRARITMTYGFSRLCDEDGKSRSISAWKAEADAYLKRNETRLGGDTE